MDGLSAAAPAHALHCGDCLEVLAGLNEASVDVVVTSPPYNLDLRYASYQDRRAEDEYLDWMVAVAEALRRVMKPDASFFLNISGSPNRPWLPFELIVRLRPVFALQNHITWIKSIATGDDSVGPFQAGRRHALPAPRARAYFPSHRRRPRAARPAWRSACRTRTSPTSPGAAMPRDLRCRGNTWFIPYETVQSRAAKFHHPGTFPVDLPRWCIRLHGRRPAVVLDPFMGTGTTLVAADARGRARHRHRHRPGLCRHRPRAAGGGNPAAFSACRLRTSRT